MKDTSNFCLPKDKLVKGLILLLSFVIFIVMSQSLYGQSNVGVKLFGVSYHPFAENNEALHKIPLDRNNDWLLEPGFTFTYEAGTGFSLTSAKLMQSIYLDQASQPAGMTYFGIHRKIFHLYKNMITIGIGPTLFYRSDWSTIDGYQEDLDYKTMGNVQYKMAWITGEIEYVYYVSKRSDMLLSINMLHPKAFTMMIGYRFWISKKAKRKACDCPGFK